MSQQNDPWVPVDGQHNTDTQTGAVLSPIRTQMEDPRLVMRSSEDYIASLEAKLSRLKGKRKEVSSRDMVDALCKVREDQMRCFVESSSDPFSSQFAEDSSTETIDTSAIQRRLHPERQALNVEELQVLVEKDELQRLKEAEEENESTDNNHRDNDNQAQSASHSSLNTPGPSMDTSSNSAEATDTVIGMQQPHR